MAVIAKHVSIKAVKKSAFAALVKYITGTQRKAERVGAVTVTNCHSDRLEVAVTEILNTQACNTRAVSDKTYHLIVSFRAGEQPGRATLLAIEARLCDGLGFGGHQRVSAVHRDTDNLHIHIAINRIDPVRHTLHTPYRDYHTLGRLCEQLEREFGLQADRHEARRCASENRAADMEHHAGVESLLGWIQRECLDAIRATRSWGELHRVMRANGLEIHPRGNGLVITAGDGTTVKASAVGRDCSRERLEARLGAFEPSPERVAGTRPAHSYEAKPVRSRIDTTALYARYQRERRDAATERGQSLDKARARRERLIEAAKRAGRFKRAAIKLLDVSRVEKKILYALTGKALLAKIEAIRRECRDACRGIDGGHRRHAWVDWLRDNATAGDQEALRALRARQVATGLGGDTVSGGEGHKPAPEAAPRPAQDSVTGHGTIIGRAGSAVVRDDGIRLQVARGSDVASLQAILRIAIARHGPLLHVEGSAAFREQVCQVAARARLDVVFDDAALERRRQDLLQTMSTSTRENSHEQTDTSERRRAAGRGAGSDGSGGAGVERPGPGRDGAAGAGGHVPEPDLGPVGRHPPPASQNRLRGLSELGVVRLAGGTAVLLPGDVPGHLEQQGTPADHDLRRPVPALEDITAQEAARRHIVELEQTTRKGADIPNYVVYDGFQGTALLAGLHTAGQHRLALLGHDGQVMVLPVDDKTARRLARLAMGDAVLLGPGGAIRTKGRHR